MIKKLYAFVADKEFYAFRKAAYAANLSIGEALTKLVIAYGKGEVEFSGKKKKEKKTAPTNTYLNDVRNTMGPVAQSLLPKNTHKAWMGGHEGGN